MESQDVNANVAWLISHPTWYVKQEQYEAKEPCEIQCENVNKNHIRCDRLHGGGKYCFMHMDSTHWYKCKFAECYSWTKDEDYRCCRHKKDRYTGNNSSRCSYIDMKGVLCTRPSHPRCFKFVPLCHKHYGSMIREKCDLCDTWTLNPYGICGWCENKEEEERRKIYNRNRHQEYNHKLKKLIELSTEGRKMGWNFSELLKERNMKYSKVRWPSKTHMLVDKLQYWKNWYLAGKDYSEFSLLWNQYVECRSRFVEDQSYKSLFCGISRKELMDEIEEELNAKKDNTERKKRLIELEKVLYNPHLA